LNLVLVICCLLDNGLEPLIPSGVGFSRLLGCPLEYAKRITEDFAISVAPTWSRLYAPGGLTMNGARGFQNLETLFKYRLFKNAEHEFVVLAGLEIEWGGTGAKGVGPEPFNVYTPTLFFGKGFGDLPPSLNWGAAVRNHRPNWVLNSGGIKNNHYELKPRHRRAGNRNGIQLSCAQLGRHAPIQHALSKIRGDGSRVT